MTAKQLDNKSQNRLETILRGAFAGPPTPLKDIPKKSGESRSERANQTLKKAKTKGSSKKAKLDAR